MTFSMTTSEVACPHDRATFLGWWSLIGSYHCDGCKAVIEPVIYHAMRGRPHTLLPENPFDAV